MKSFLYGAKEIEKAVQIVGSLLKKNFRSGVTDKKIKGERDFVVREDLKSENLIVRAIQKNFPGHDILGEECGRLSSKSDYLWVIDPLCGTNNFTFGLPFYGVAVGLMNKDKFIYGLIYIPEREAMLSAEIGKGAFLNKKPIKISCNRNLSEAVILYDNQFHRSKVSAPNILKIWPKVFTLRITGSAAYDNFLVASGVADARIFHNTKLVDFAAAVPIIEEAGGRISDFNGQSVNANSTAIVVSNAFIHNDLIRLMNKDII